MRLHPHPAFFLLATLCTTPAFPQTPQLLTHLGRQADELQHKLPNFSCDESVVSEIVEHGKVRHHTTFTTTIRAQRNAKGILEEHLGDQTYTVNIFSALVHHIPSSPLFVSGGFSQALDYFSTADQACYDYRFSPGRVDFTSLPTPPSACRSSGTQGFALLDADSNVTHLERTVQHDLAVARNQAQFAAVDFAPVELDGQTFRLSHHVVAEMPDDKGNLRRFTAEFSKCKLFTATVTIKPATP